MASDPGRYDIVPEIGLLYDHVAMYGARADVAFYVEEARRAALRGGVLELGCGTGRILIPSARAGVSITGVDGSREMLERCRAKLAAELAEVRDRVQLVHADVLDVALDQKFALVTAPFRVFQSLITIEDQLVFLATAARHLEPDGILVFDVFNPSFARMVGHDAAEHEDTADQRLPDGRTFRRAFRISRVRWAEQVNDVELLWYVSDGQATQRHVQALPMRWFMPTELVHLLRRAGFELVDMYGDFARGALGDGSPEIVVRARSA